MTAPTGAIAPLTPVRVRSTEALKHLKIKQMLEKQLDNVSAMMMTLDQQRLALEEVTATKVTVEALQTSKAAMAAASKSVKVENIEQLVEDVQELNEQQNDATAALAAPMFQAADADVRGLAPELPRLRTCRSQSLPTTRRKLPCGSSRSCNSRRSWSK